MTPCQKCKAERDRLAAELQREKDRRVEHRQQNQTLNEAVQRAERENARLTEKGYAAGLKLIDAYAAAHQAERERDALKVALSSAIDRLNEFLQAFEGQPEPSENDTKHLVARLIGVLQTGS